MKINFSEKIEVEKSLLSPTVQGTFLQPTYDISEWQKFIADYKLINGFTIIEKALLKIH